MRLTKLVIRMIPLIIVCKEHHRNPLSTLEFMYLKKYEGEDK